MKALLTALAFLSFVAAFTPPNLASAQGTTGDQPKGDQTMSRPDSNMSRPDTEKGATAAPAQAGHKAATHRTKRRTSGKKAHHHTSKKTKAREAAPPKEG